MDWKSEFPDMPERTEHVNLDVTRTGWYIWEGTPSGVP